MATYDFNWARWITSSVNKWITNNNPGAITLYFEGTERKTDTNLSHIEVRYDGPHFKQVTAENWLIDLTVNLLIYCAMEKDGYKMDRLIGRAVAMLPTAIPVFKLIDDPLVKLDCLTRKGLHKVHRFGQVREKTKLILAVVETQYQLEL